MSAALSFVDDSRAAPTDLTPPSYERGRVVRNWAATHESRPARYAEPASVAEVAAVLADARAAGATLRVVGAAHSPNESAMGSEVVVSLARMAGVLAVDAARGLVRVQAGIAVSALNAALDAHGLALDNLGSISDQTVAGMICTGTHGTGAAKPSLSGMVVELQLVTPAGDVVVCSAARNAGAEWRCGVFGGMRYGFSRKLVRNRRERVRAVRRHALRLVTSRRPGSVTTHPRPAAPPTDVFHAALCSLGCLGVITGAVLRAVPAFDLRATTTPVRLRDALVDIGARARSAPYYRLWWFPHTPHCIEWRAAPCAPRTSRPPPPPELLAPLLRAAAWLRDVFFGFHLLQFALWLSVALPALVPAINAVWFAALFARPTVAVDASVRVFNFDCLFKQHVDEWSLPLGALAEVRCPVDGGADGSGSRRRTRANCATPTHACHPPPAQYTRHPRAGDDGARARPHVVAPVVPPRRRWRRAGGRRCSAPAPRPLPRGSAVCRHGPRVVVAGVRPAGRSARVRRHHHVPVRGGGRQRGGERWGCKVS